MKTESKSFEDDFEKIMKWYRDENRYPLSDSLKARLHRWKSAREFILTMRPLTDSNTVDFIINSTGVSEPQAWRDIKDCKRFFTSMERTNKEFDRTMLVADIRSLRAKAEIAKDLRTAAQCNATLEKMGVGEQLESDQGISKDIEIVIGFNPQLIGAKENPNLLKEATRFIGEEAARRELLIQDDVI